MERMDRISDTNQIEALLSAERKKHKPLYTNCMLFSGALDEYASKGRLYYEQYDDGIVLLYDAGYYFSMYYHISPNTGIRFERHEKPVVIDFQDSVQRHHKQYDVMIPYWENAGFSFNAKLMRMIAEYDEHALNALIHSHKTEYEVITARPEHYEPILCLLFDAFDPVKNLLHSREDLLEEMDAGEFQCIVDEDGEVMCALQSSVKDGVFHMHHVVVDPKHRGKNLSWHLRKDATEKAFKQGVRKREGWTVEGNTAGIIAAEKIGLKFDGRFITQYIMEAHN
jgi:GNAT superfamily N-acetyltransferase